MAIDRPQVIASAEKLVARGKIEAAIKEYRKLLAENPNDASTLNRLGDLYARIDRIDEAVRLREAQPKPTPTPKPGEWMYDKKRKSALDATPRR